jgi:hypothetical protein
MPARQKGSAHSLPAKSRPRERDELAAVAVQGRPQRRSVLSFRKRPKAGSRGWPDVRIG